MNETRIFVDPADSNTRIVVFTLLQTAYSQAPGRQTLVQSQEKSYQYPAASRCMLDSFSIIPRTVLIPGISDSLFQVDYVNATLTWKGPPVPDNVLIQYRVFDMRLNAKVQRMQFDSVMNRLAGQPYIPILPGEEERFFDFGNLNYSGSFGRGIAFGNSQDAVVTSNLNLQLSGFLADSVEIVAAITDNNIPIQPDGTNANIERVRQNISSIQKKRTEALSLE